MVIKLSMSKEGIQDLIHTLEICIKELPVNTHPVHRQRLKALTEELRHQANNI